jgi:class 3 adenylate cyclase
MKDSVYGNERMKELTQLELNFQFEKEQLADSLEFVRTSLIQEKKISNQRIGLFSTGVITAIMVLLAVVVYQGKQRSEKLLLNILPKEVATELKNTGKAKARHFDNVTVIFTDFKGFTQMSENLSAESLVSEINLCFSEFDSIMTKYGVEKIKTIGDAYMAVSGLPIPNEKHAQSAVLATLEMVAFMKKRKEALAEEGKIGFEMRVGVHSGDVVAGIVGTKKFQYDIWGDTVNTAARMESSGEVSKVNISDATHQLVKDEFQCTPRGELNVKGKGMVNMFFVDAVNQTSSTSVS